MKKTGIRNLLTISVVLVSAVLVSCTDTQVTTPMTDAVAVLDFSDREGIGTVGSVNPGVQLTGGKRRASLRRGGDGRVAEFSGGYLQPPDGESIRIAVEGDFSLATRFYLGEDYFDMDRRLDAVLFEWAGRNTAEKPGRNFISLEVFNIGYVKDNRYLGCWVGDGGSNLCLSVSLKKLKPGWQDVQVRFADGNGQLFVNGVACSPEKDFRSSRVWWTPGFTSFIRDNYLRVGANRREEHPFRGSIDFIAFWNRSLDDTELSALSDVDEADTVWPVPADAMTCWAGLYEEDIKPEDALRRLTEDCRNWISRALKEDKYFPAYHLVFPGVGTENSTSSYLKDAYHVFPHGCNLWRGGVGVHIGHCGPLYGKGWLGDHLWLHYMGSKDLLDWQFMPVPEWNTDSLHRPCTGNVIEKDGVAYSFPTGIELDGIWYRQRGDIQQDSVTHPGGREGEDFTPPGGFYHKWISTDPDLSRWKFDGVIDWPVPDRSGINPINCFTFGHEGQWYTLGSYECYPGLGGRVELYRAMDEDFNNWEYVGEFYNGTTHIIHHPHLFKVDGKVVLSSGFVSVDKDVTAVIGHIADDRFIRERGDFYAFMHDRSRGNRSGGTSTWGQTITAPDGRVLRLHTIAENPGSCDMFTANDIVRMGWRNVHTMPHEVYLDDNEMAFSPAEEFEGLRKKSLFSSESLEIGKGEEWFADLGGNRSHIEVRCRFRPSQDAVSGIVLEAGEVNRLRFYYDRKQSLLVLDYGQSNALGKSAVETELKLAPEEEADLRLFFDASVIEVFANGKRSFGRWYTGSPADIRVGLFSENAPTVFSRADVWEMGTIWKEYTGKPADAE